MLVAAATGADGGQDYIQWALDQGGAFLVALVCAFGWWQAEKRVVKAETRADAERTARDVLATKVMDQLVPAVERSTTATAEFVIEAREIQRRQGEHR